LLLCTFYFAVVNVTTQAAHSAIPLGNLGNCQLDFL
jgi:hypothetical protein